MAITEQNIMIRDCGLTMQTIFMRRTVKALVLFIQKEQEKPQTHKGATKEGWFKIYRSGNDLDFKWQSNTYDNNGHDVFVVFNNAGIYLMEISARSSGHGIDKFALFHSSVEKSEAITSTNFSAISCD